MGDGRYSLLVVPPSGAASAAYLVVAVHAEGYGLLVVNTVGNMHYRPSPEACHKKIASQQGTP